MSVQTSKGQCSIGTRAYLISPACAERKVTDVRAIGLTAAVLVLATAGWAEGGFTVDSKGKAQWPAAEAQKIYNSVCAVVEQELGGNRAVRPQFKVVLGGAKNSVNYDQRELTLTKWDPYLFAQGVVMLSVEDLMSPKQRAELARRAVTWADATIDVHHLTK
jgi:hypothetical protein